MRLELKSHAVTVGWRRTRLLDDVDLAFEDDRCHCLVGINGVGKTAFLLSMTLRGALRRPDGSWQPAMYTSPREIVSGEAVTVEGFARLFPHRPQLDRWALEAAARRPVQSLSQGEKTRLMLSVADAIEPTCLLVDEPTLGLDMESQKTLGEFIRRRIERRLTTIVSTHDLVALDTEGCRIIYMHRVDGESRIVEGEDRLVRGRAELALADGETRSIEGSAATIARNLVAMQIERFR